MKLSVSGFARMTEIIKGLADELCSGRLVLTLEGGYNLNALAASVKATFDVLSGNTDIEDPLGEPQSGFKLRGFKPPDINSLIDKIKRIHSLP
jgi:acetoin utilization deacetylase AcuC-like enzyme